jgi:hypothetical protein
MCSAPKLNLEARVVELEKQVAELIAYVTRVEKGCADLLSDYANSGRPMPWEDGRP